jgi:hypothetical protein
MAKDDFCHAFIKYNMLYEGLIFFMAYYDVNSLNKLSKLAFFWLS